MTTAMDGKLTPWLDHTQPFHVGLAASDHLLDRRLERYQAYRHRLVEEMEARVRSA